MYMPGPATFVVMLLVGMLLIVGVLVLGTGRRRSSIRRTIEARRASLKRGGEQAGDGELTCGQCGLRNQHGARYCARCGRPLAAD